MRRGIVIVNPDLPQNIRSHLTAIGWDTVAVMHCRSVLEPIAGHPDLQICCMDEDVVVHPHVQDSLLQVIEDNGYRVITGDSHLSPEYPADVPYNAVLIKNHFFHNIAHTDPMLRRRAQNLGATFVHVNQGYTRCSVLQVSDDALITADKGIARQAEKHGLQALCIRQGHVILPSMNTGFFGGTGGWDGADSVFLCGMIDNHPDASDITKFISDCHKQLICLGQDQLTDYGSLLFLPLRR